MEKSEDTNSCGSVSSTSVGVVNRRRNSATANNLTVAKSVPGGQSRPSSTGSPRDVSQTPPTPPVTIPTPTVTPSLRSTPSPSHSSGTPGTSLHPQSSQTSNNNSNKIISRNVNGTMTVTSAPSNEAELQLYRVMQRASLLSYYDTLLEMGGDDLQQLCDAGEEEFLEIMALIGMASKPLHVRRLQKALHEWMTNPTLFQIPLINYNEFVPFSVPNTRFLFQQTAAFAALKKEIVAHQANFCDALQTTSPPTPSSSAPTDFSRFLNTSIPAVNKRTHSPVLEGPHGSSSTASSPGPPANPGSPHQPVSIASLSENQIAQITESAKRLCALLPHVEPKVSNTKKKINKELELVMMMKEDNPRRMEEIRKFSAIYGRFDCKRKAEKPLTLHELSVNEAAAQLCKFVPALLMRRDELFPLARQVVRDCDYHRLSKVNITMSPSRTRSVSTNSSDSEANFANSEEFQRESRRPERTKTPCSNGSSPGR